MKTYDIHYYETASLTPGEQDCVRAGADGVWLYAGQIEAENQQKACVIWRLRRRLGCDARKLRAKEVRA